MRQKLVITDDIVLDLPAGPIGISFSGGVDSSLLVYLVMKQFKNEVVHLFTVSTVERNLSQHKITSDVLNKICQLTGNYNVVQHMLIQNTNVEGAANLQVLPNKMLYEQQIVTSILYGDNRNPPKNCGIDGIEQFEMFNESSRSPNGYRSLMISPGRYWPLTNLDKQDVIKIYHQHNILDTLFPLTRSCGKEYGTSPCGTCWFCKERQWGLDILN